jgi:phosphohistidine phosphatase
MEANASRRLLLLRHAKSAWPREVPDQDRPLAQRGRRDAPVAGRWLQQAGYVPDHVLCSPARRARETWQLAERELAVRPPVVYEPGVYAASASSLLGIVRRQPSAARTIVVVGHDPALPELALELAREDDHTESAAAAPTPGSAFGRMQAKFPTAAIAVLELTAPWAELGHGQAQMVNFVTPRDMDDGHPG